MRQIMDVAAEEYRLDVQVRGRDPVGRGPLRVVKDVRIKRHLVRMQRHFTLRHRRFTFMITSGGWRLGTLPRYMGRQPVIGGLLLVANGPGDAACAGASQALAVTAL